MMTKWRYEESTKTIRDVPSNHWIASMDSWDGAEDHEANAQLIASAPELAATNTALLEACEYALRETVRPSSDPLIKSLKAAIRKATE